VSAVVTLPLLVYEALLVPAHHSNQVIGVILSGLYLCFLIGALGWVRPSLLPHR